MKKIKLLYKQYKEIINYIIVGGMTTVVGLGIYYLLVISILNPLKPLELQIANICSWIGAVAFAYFTNRKFVFESQNQNKVKEAFQFVLSRVATLFIDMGGMFFLVTLCTVNDKVAKLIIQVVVIVVNYLLSKLIVFKKEKIKGDTSS
nr:GtrA family protein [uncultured Blautia sp.]